MIRKFITTGTLMALCTFSFSQNVPQMTFLIESLDNSIVDKASFPIGTTFYVSQPNKKEEPVKTKNFVTYVGDIDLTIFPLDKTETAIKKSLKNHSLTVFYFTEDKLEPVTKVVQKDGLPLLESNTEKFQYDSFQLGVSVYPNPATSTLNIEWPEIESDNLNIEILNYTGSVIRSLSIEEVRRLALDISGLESGLYLLLFKEGPTLLTSKKILLNTGT